MSEDRVKVHVDGDPSKGQVVKPLERTARAVGADLVDVLTRAQGGHLPLFCLKSKAIRGNVEWVGFRDGGGFRERTWLPGRPRVVYGSRQPKQSSMNLPGPDVVHVVSLDPRYRWVEVATGGAVLARLFQVPVPRSYRLPDGLAVDYIEGTAFPSTVVDLDDVDPAELARDRALQIGGWGVSLILADLWVVPDDLAPAAGAEVTPTHARNRAWVRQAKAMVTERPDLCTKAGRPSWRTVARAMQDSGIATAVGVDALREILRDEWDAD